MSAACPATAWNVASGRPNCSRATYRAVRPSAPATAPSARRPLRRRPAGTGRSTAPPSSRRARRRRGGVQPDRVLGRAGRRGRPAHATPSAAGRPPRPPAAADRAAGTRIQRAWPANGTPIFVPVTVPDAGAPATVAGRRASADGSRTAAVRDVSRCPLRPAASGSSRPPHRATGSAPSMMVASAGTGAACRPTSVSRTAASSTPRSSPPIQPGSVSRAARPWPSTGHSPVRRVPRCRFFEDIGDHRPRDGLPALIRARSPYSSPISPGE